MGASVSPIGRWQLIGPAPGHEATPRFAHARGRAPSPANRPPCLTRPLALPTRRYYHRSSKLDVDMRLSHQDSGMRTSNGVAVPALMGRDAVLFTDSDALRT